MNSWSPLFADPNQTSEDGDMSKSRDEDSLASSKKDPPVTPELFTNRNKTGKFSDNRWKPNGFSNVEHGSQSRVVKCNHDALGTTIRKFDIFEVAREKFSSGDQVPRAAQPELINEGDYGYKVNYEVGLENHIGLNESVRVGQDYQDGFNGLELSLEETHVSVTLINNKGDKVS
ncbi:hypothetical protein L1987_65581 [Smallanthus sonchifolius]|uniref:Uncharacterized protein n=1 Tax=Smallanthus sonchifolius TaxID=185202 RepID=A0ACB9BUT1_9ASTR|nr:hypothetical protein L1987_65581 [Smallanthus sonchifolius]